MVRVEVVESPGVTRLGGAYEVSHESDSSNVQAQVETEICFIYSRAQMHSMMSVFYLSDPLTRACRSAGPVSVASVAACFYLNA